MQFFALGMWRDNTYIYFCLQYDPKASLTSESNFKPLDQGITTNQFCHLDGLSIDLCQWSNQPIQEFPRELYRHWPTYDWQGI